PAGGRGPCHHVFSYDWRRDLIETARRLHDTLETLAEACGDPAARFNVIGHSMGGLVARYYLRYGTAEPDAGPVTWAGARRIANLVLVAVPNAAASPRLLVRCASCSWAGIACRPWPAASCPRSAACPRGSSPGTGRRTT